MNTPERDEHGVMITPKSDAAIKLFPEFCARVQQRLESGKRVYGDSSFDRTMEGLVEEIRQEVLDVAGWAVIAYAKLKGIEEKIAGLAQTLREEQAPDSEEHKTRIMFQGLVYLVCGELDILLDRHVSRGTGTLATEEEILKALRMLRPIKEQGKWS